MTGYVLIVDDNRDAREVFSTALTYFGLTTRTASNGEEALAHARLQPPDLILLDLMMPQMSGFQLIAHLRKDPAMRQVPIIVVSASGINTQAALTLPGVTHVIPKEKFSIQALKTLVGETLGLELSP